MTRRDLIKTGVMGLAPVRMKFGQWEKIEHGSGITAWNLKRKNKVVGFVVENSNNPSIDAGFVPPGSTAAFRTVGAAKRWVEKWAK